MNRIRRFLTLGVIVGPLPNNILNGSIIDAVPVMANFNWIVAQVNANAGAGAITNSLSIPTFVPPASTSGTANAISLLPTPAITAYAAGQRFSFIPPAAPNTGATTISVSSLAVRNLVYADGTAMSGGELLAAGVYDIEDNGTAYVLMNSAQGSSFGTWTPVLRFGGLSVGITYGTQVGQYLKIGRLVHYWIDVVLTAKGSSTGAATFSGLPFTVNASLSGGGFTPGGPSLWGVLTYGAVTPELAPFPGSVILGVVSQVSAGAVTTVADTAFANTTSVRGYGTYLV